MKFLSMIAQDRWYDPNRVVGYSAEELVKIEKLYDIKIKDLIKMVKLLFMIRGMGLVIK